MSEPIDRDDFEGIPEAELTDDELAEAERFYAEHDPDEWRRAMRGTQTREEREAAEGDT